MLIEDETDLVEMSRMYLERDGFTVLDAPDRRSAQALLARRTVNLIVLDLGLPDGNGLELLRDIGDTPVIIVTGRGEETDRVVGLELGADDYLVKPFSQRELAARIRAVLRRTAPRPATGPAPVVDVGGLQVNTDARQISADGEPIAFTPLEYALLAYLATAPGQTFSPQQLLDQVWDAGGWAAPATVAEHVYRVRRKLVAASVRTPRITTVRGFGYRLDL